MANGGWYGTEEAWARIEAPLLLLDPELERFSQKYNLRLTRNNKDRPERSLTWGFDVQCLIQIYLNDEAALTWTLWLCAYQDRGESRFWEKETACEKMQVSDIAKGLPDILENAKRKIDYWSAHPETLEFAVKLQR